jgi:hypothetical protein
MKEKNIIEEQALKEIAKKHEKYAKEIHQQEEKDAEEWHIENDFKNFN